MKNYFPKRLVFFSGNIAASPYETDITFRNLVSLMQHAAALGYNGLVFNAIGGGSFASQASPGKASNFDRNMSRLAVCAQTAGMELIPVGLNPESIASLYPALVEAIPVKSRPLKVVGKNVITAATPIFSGGISGWDRFDDVPIDSQTTRSGKGSAVLDAASGKSMMRVMRQVDGLEPFAAYRLKFCIKTQNFDAPLALQIFADNSDNPIYRNQAFGLGQSTANGQLDATGNIVKSTQGWVQYSVDFNTLTNSTIRIYLGVWRAGTLPGKAWIDDLDLREVNFSNVVERDGCPIVLMSADGSRQYVRGKDFALAPDRLIVLPNSTLSDGDILFGTWGQNSSGMVTPTGPASAAYQEFFDIVGQIYRPTYEVLNKPRGMFVYLNEWRVSNWDSRSEIENAGDYVGKTFRRIEDQIQAINPEADVYVWSDMFDPGHNAKPAYWMCKGSMAGAANWLSQNTIIVNWNDHGADAQRASLQFFQKFQQVVALYYDDRTLQKADQWINSVKAAGVDIEGFMFTTWVGNYADLEAVTAKIRAAFPGRWPAEIKVAA